MRVSSASPIDSESVDLMTSSERLAPGTTPSHRPHRCTVTGCGKEFKLKAHLARHCATAHGLALRAGSPRPVVKTRAAFYLCTTRLTRAARRLCGPQALRPRHAARNPFLPVNLGAIRLECQSKLLADGTAPPTAPRRPRERGAVVDVSHRLGTPNLPRPEWLHPTPREQIPVPVRQAFPPMARREEPPPPPPPPMQRMGASLLRKRPYEGAANGADMGPRRRLQPPPLNGGRPKVSYRCYTGV